MADPNVDPNAPAVDPPPAADPTFFDGYSDALKSNPGMEKFKDKGQDDIANSYLELSARFGADKFVIPKADDAEGLSNALAALGRPETSDGYALNNENIPEGLDIKAYTELAFKSGLLPSQAAKMWDEFTQMTRDGQSQFAEAQKKDFGEKSTALRSLWGGKYDENINLADRVIDKFAADENDAAQLKELVKANPSLLRTLVGAGSVMSENSIGDFKPVSFTLSPAEAKDKINQGYSGIFNIRMKLIPSIGVRKEVIQVFITTG